MAVTVHSSSTDTLAAPLSVLGSMPSAGCGLEVGLLTGGIDKPYVFGLSRALAAKGVCLEIVGSDEIDSPEYHSRPNLRFLNLRGNQEEAGLATKTRRILTYYSRLIRYAWVAGPKIFHILWNNRFQTFDRTVLMMYYKLLGKKIVFTAHNVNAAKRDSKDSAWNRMSLRIQYRLADHIFVHTEKMRAEMLADFGVRPQAVTVIPFGINDAVPHTALTSEQARERLGIKNGEKAMLFFGRIGPYKGLEYLVSAFERIAAEDEGYRLIIAGKPKGGSEKYLAEIQKTIARNIQPGRVIQKIEFVPDEDTELYFKAADVLILPYTEVFQSGVLFLGYSFGVPVIATDVGSMKAGIVEGRTGLLCQPNDSHDLARAIRAYFASDLYRDKDERGGEIRNYANAQNSWAVVSDHTIRVYAELLGGSPA